jgi:hypothetical protein
MVDGIRLVNSGSVGWPYADQAGAYWAVLSDAGIEFRRTQNDLQAAADRIRRSGWPAAAAFAEENVLSVPSVEEATAGLEQMRLSQAAS